MNKEIIAPASDNEYRYIFRYMKKV